jgi:hypothetical protein
VLANFGLGITSIDKTIIQTEEIFKRELSYPWGQCGTKPRTQPFKTERGFFFCYSVAMLQPLFATILAMHRGLAAGHPTSMLFL